LCNCRACAAASASDRFGAGAVRGIVTRASDCTRKVTCQRVAIVNVIGVSPSLERTLSSDLPALWIIAPDIDFVNIEIDFIYISLRADERTKKSR
jgi:hypothetical protein